MADYKLDKYHNAVAALKEKYPNARLSTWIDKMHDETWDSEQGKMSKEYGDVVDEYNKPSAEAGRGKVNPPNAYKKGGKVKATNKSSASKRGDGIAQRGHTKGRYL